MIEKAIIPIAGMGSRLAPLTAAVPKAMFPLVDAQGRCRPVIHWILAQACAAGAGQAAIIVSPAQREILERYLQAAAGQGSDLPSAIEFIVQPQPAGFGEAVLRAQPFTGHDDFLLLLGDHVYLSPPGGPACAAQVSQAFNQHDAAAMVSMRVVDESQLAAVGVARGEPLDAAIYRCTDFAEKPDVSLARQRLVTPGLSRGHYLAHGGIYAFDAEIFDCLAQLASQPRAGELQLADAQSVLLARHPQRYFLLRLGGRALDTGTPQGYAQAQQAFAAGDAQP